MLLLLLIFLLNFSIQHIQNKYDNEPIVPIINNFLNDDIAFNCDTIKLILQQLPNKFSSGPDAIKTFLLKMFFDELCLPMALNFYKSLN